MRGQLLGGPVGVGAVLLASGTGPAVPVALRLLHRPPVRPAAPAPA